ncbi:MAG: hypothetical protein KF729_24505 [Sandaracinaceae bacterium]|nr:hypothetical protein [Sandaracinaceae bacterium]
MRRWSAFALLFVSACGTPATAAPKLEALARLSRCAGPEGLDDCSLERFEETFADRLPRLRAHRDAVVERWRASLEAGSHAAAYGLAWADDRASLPALRRGLLEERYFYGWESSDAFTIEARMRDEQYPRHLARVRAIEHLSRADLATAVGLTPDERAALVRDAYAEGEAGGPHDAARWLLARLAPDALVAAPPRRTDVAPLAIPPALDGWVLVSHDSFGHHDVFPIARAHAGSLTSSDPIDGCEVLPGREVTLDGRSVTLPTELLDDEVNRCLAEPEGLARGSSVTALDLDLRGQPVELDPAQRARAEARALEALARSTGADPADFAGTVDEVVAVGDGTHTRVVVRAHATPRPRTMDDRTIPCASALCAVARQGDGPAASVVAVLALGDGHTLDLALVVPSSPGGCGEAEHDEVSFIGAVLLEGAPPTFAIERRYCDGWEVELHAEGASHLVGNRGGSAI